MVETVGDTKTDSKATEIIKNFIPELIEPSLTNGHKPGNTKKKREKTRFFLCPDYL